MSLKNQSEVRDVHGITDEEEQRILDFLQGAVYCWCKNRPDEWFALRDLMGGDNNDWTGTPMMVLYEKHINKGKSIDDSVVAAAIDGGWLLKKTLNEDTIREYDDQGSYSKQYKWI